MPDPLAQLDSALAALNTATAAVTQVRDIIVRASTLPAGTDLATLPVSDGAVHHLHGDYVVTKPLAEIIGKVQFLGVGGATVRWTGQAAQDGTFLFACGAKTTGLTLDGIDWANANATPNRQKWGNLSLIRAGGANNILSNAKCTGFKDVMLVEQPCDGITMDTVVIRDLRGYGFYGEGNRVRIKMDVDRSATEAALRIEGATDVEVYDSILDARDERALGPAYAGSYGKAGFRDHFGKGHKFRNVKARVWTVAADGTETLKQTNAVDIGPESSNSPVSTSGNRAEDIVVEGGEFGGVAVIGGTSNLTFNGSTIFFGGDANGLFLLGYNKQYNRTVDGVNLIGVAFKTSAERACFLRMNVGTKNVTAEDCTLEAPNAVCQAAYDQLYVLCDDTAWPLTVKGSLNLPKPARYGDAGKYVARLGEKYLTAEQFTAAFPGAVFA